MLETGISDLSQQFESIVEALSLSLQAAENKEAEEMLKVIQAMRQNIQIMLRLDSDIENTQQAGITEDEVSKMGDYALNLLDEISAGCGSRGMQEQMLQLQRLSLPVVAWLNFHHAKVTKLEIVVNAVASYANTLQDEKQLEALCSLINQVVQATDPSVKSDLEAANPMRPWRILNLNWGIVATRSHNPECMIQVFEQLMLNIPADVQQFFNEGLQQMDIIGYPEPVRAVMREYAGRVGASGGDSVLH
ncbi:hypothetical protein MNBD_GAMMA11-3326 [hydrothermal vent metagenome]|uniref:Uncharacterized protein n=1 Tax=hydrothermal vent metagenome TaxID=652676 RepID=A0A3B0YDI5_9ZZZZ